MNTPTIAQLDSLIQTAARQRILEALQRPGVTLDQLSKILKLHQKTIDQELKAKDLESKKEELAFKKQKLAAEIEKDARKLNKVDEKPATNEPGAKSTPPAPPIEKRKPVWPEVEAIIANVREKKRLDALDAEEEALAEEE